MDARPLLDWLLTEGREVNDLAVLLRAVSARLAQLGVPVDRTVFASFVLHPQVAALSARWVADGDEVSLEEVPHDFFEGQEDAGSPFFEVRRERRPLRVHLHQLRSHPYPTLHELIDQGYTDYAAFPVFLGGVPQGGLTFASRAPDGFGPGCVELLGEIIPALTAVMERVLRDFVTRRLLMAYLGADAGDRVFRGQVRRGDGQTIRPCIWFSDLRGFTALSDSVEPPALLDILNDTFDLLVGAIQAEGGEVLKFIGDGLLAVFLDDDAKAACQRGLRAARGAQERLAALRVERRRTGGY
jgi:adenylate cyclase